MVRQCVGRAVSSVYRRVQRLCNINDELVGLADEMRGMRDEFRRWKAVEEAIATERDLDAWLN
jgi:hypothetical protein